MQVTLKSCKHHCVAYRQATQAYNKSVLVRRHIWNCKAMLTHNKPNSSEENWKKA